MANIVKFSSGNASGLSNVAVSNGNVLIAKDTRSLYFDLDNARLEITDFVEVATLEELEDILTPVAKKFYYVEETNGLYKNTSNGWVRITAEMTEVIDDLTHEDTDKALSANQGKVLDEKIDDLIWTGTKEEYLAAKEAGLIKEGQMINITDDDDITVIDLLPIKDSTNPVSSNGVFVTLAEKVNVADVVTTISQHSTDEKVPSAKAVYDKISASINDANSFALEKLDEHIEESELKYATKVDAELLGTPTAPTATLDINNSQVATTAFVHAAIAKFASKLVTSLDASSTDDEIPTAKSVYVMIKELQEALTGMMTEYEKFGE